MVIRRRLVAVVFADIAGYSRLMERDEAGTYERLRALRDGLLSPAMAAHGGRLVDSAGDGFLLAFASTTEALRWAVEVQRAMAARNVGIAPDDRIEFRIGVNLGDVIVDGAKIGGEDVNLAERLETLATPGGICVAAAVREQMHEDLGVTFVDAGTHHVKNFAKPVHLYRVVIPDASPAANAKRKSAGARWTRRFRSMPTFGVALAVAVLLAIVVAAGLVWWQASQRQERAPPASGSLPSSILVAPFVAVPGDPLLPALAVGLGRDVARALANSLRDVRVVGPEFQARGDKDPRDERALARAAEVRYVLSASVSEAGEDIVVTARLVDGMTAAELGSERRTIARVREKEDRALLVSRVTAAARLMFQSAEGRRIAAEPLRPDDARSLVAHANALFARNDRTSTLAARKLYEQARERDPALVAAWTGHLLTLGWEHWNDFKAGRNEQLLAEIDFDSRRAVALDDRDPNAWFARAVALTLRWQWRAALEANDRAIALDPTRSRFRLQRSLIYYMSGRASESLHEIGRAIATLGAPDSDFLYYACHAHIHLGQYEEAIDKCGRAVVADNSYYFVHLDLTVAYAQTGDMTRARAAKAELLRRAPDFTIARFEAKRFSDDPVWQEEVQKRFLPGLRKAGVPEG